MSVFPRDLCYALAEDVRARLAFSLVKLLIDNVPVI
jgi:hypothetical protein